MCHFVRFLARFWVDSLHPEAAVSLDRIAVLGSESYTYRPDYGCLGRLDASGSGRSHVTKGLPSLHTPARWCQQRWGHRVPRRKGHKASKMTDRLDHSCALLGQPYPLGPPASSRHALGLAPLRQRLGAATLYAAPPGDPNGPRGVMGWLLARCATAGCAWRG